MGIRISVSEIMDWESCAWLWDYKYQRKVRVQRELDESEDMAFTVSGSAIHFGVEWMLSGVASGTHEQLLDEGVKAGYAYLDRFDGRAARLKPGVARAISAFPPGLLEKRPVTEARYSEVVEEFDVQWRPDLWWFEDGVIHVMDVKSTSKDPNQQLEFYGVFDTKTRYYAWLLHRQLSRLEVVVPPIFISHLILTTKGKVVRGSPQLVGLGEISRLEERFLGKARLVRTHDYPTEGYRCQSCEFKDVCAIRLTGGDWEDKLIPRFDKPASV